MFWERSDSTLSDVQLKAIKVIEIAPEAALDYVHPFLGRIGWVQGEICAKIGTGTFSRVFPIRDFGNDLLPDRHYVARFNVHPSVSTQSLHLESWAANEALARGFPTPRIVHVDTSRVHAPYPFQVIEYVDGLTLRSAPEETVRKVLSKLGTALARLHAGPPPSDRYGRIGLGTLPEWDLFITNEVPDHLTYCREHGLITKEQREAIEEAFVPVFLLNEPALMHGDLSYDNILIDGSTQDLKSVIDWEDAVLGDHIFELAGLATFHPVERHAFFLDAYYADTERPSDFEYRFWVYYLRIALAKSVHRHRFGYPDEPVYRNNPDIAYQVANTRISLALSKLKDLT